MLIDTHCHIHFNAYKNDMDEVIQRTLSKDVQMITVGTQKDTSRHALEIAEKYDGLWATVGLHPNHLTAQEFWDDEEIPKDKIKTRTEVFDPDFYLELAKHPKCVAIGEFGLDYYHLPKHLDVEEIKELQRKTVLEHFDLATKADLPVVIHSRDAHEEQFELIKDALSKGKLSCKGVIHCFTGTLEQAQAYIEIGFLISFTGIITFPPRKKEGEISPLQKVVQDLPLESIMLETDAPYLAPVPHRGKRNEPWYVIDIAKKVAELKGISLEEVEEQTNKTAKKFFKLKTEQE